MPAPTSNPRIYADRHRPPHVHVLYDNSLNRSFSPPVASSAMLGYLAHRQNPPLHLFPANPYPSPPPPPPISHKVWILDCKSCGTFITNRGMKAVLLLRPNVSLYSSDALPINCSAYTSNPDVLRSRASCRPPLPHFPPRTCECLTQTLCCHGCGATIGYMIVIPCARCTSSITATNRATNGHRFVFHSSEITATERHYIAEEPSVIPYDPVAVTVSSESSASHPAHPPMQASHPDPHAAYRTQGYAYRSRSSSPVPMSDYLPTPPLEFADPSLASPPDSFPFPREYTPLEFHTSPHSQHYLPPHHSRPPVPPQYASHLPHRPTSSVSSPSDSSSPPSLNHSSFAFDSPAEQKEQPAPPRKLQSGDVLFWHHLARNGEIPGVEDDSRAREKQPTFAAAAGARGKIVATLSFSR
ncbi:hypothetical protein D9615_004505 [Tricholomella constricta]|uniref:Protein FAM72A n=1 Tax=Tricholomella constricta TaxID=117010 RepID=A0A8H5M4B4_9AGAR|nr:hypothetical protein D9615_004505 [Tricholomella constricta]